ncbi:hypothetical protein NC651_027772 [Populus alba x Populus x berolinensis]|nr:hypothetical protein NC651_027772 [Populus alba x Populus x berolinensis]
MELLLFRLKHCFSSEGRQIWLPEEKLLRVLSLIDKISVDLHSFAPFQLVAKFENGFFQRYREGAQDMIAATSAVAKVAAAAAASHLQYSSFLPSVAVTPMAQYHRLKIIQHKQYSMHGLNSWDIITQFILENSIAGEGNVQHMNEIHGVNRSADWAFMGAICGRIVLLMKLPAIFCCIESYIGLC